jgi:localization factor PodJL
MRTGMLKKLRPETREAAIAAARRSGQSVEDWLDSAIAQSAAEAEDDDLFEDDGVQDRLDELTRKIDRLAGGGPAAYAPLRSRNNAGGKSQNDGNDPLVSMVERLDRRLDQFVNFAHTMPSVVRRPQTQGLNPGVHQAVAEITARQRLLRGEDTAPTPVAPRLRPRQLKPQPQPRSIAAQVDAQYSHAAGYPASYAAPVHAAHAAPAPAAYVPQPPPAPLPPVPAQAAQPVLQPQAPLPTQDISGLEKQLRTITNQIETLRKPGVEEAINALRAELSQIAQALTDAMPRHVIDAIDAQIQNLAQRLSEGRQAGVGGEVLASIEQHLGDIHSALRSLTPAENLDGFNETVSALAQRIDLIVAQKDPTSFAQLEDAINNLRAMSAHIASNDAVQQLAEQVQALNAKVDQIAYTSSGDAALAHLEERISSLADAIATRNQNGGEVPRHLENLVGSLSDKIEQIHTSRAEGMNTTHLEDRIVRLAEKLDASDSRLANLEAVERGMAELLAQTDRLGRAHAEGAGTSNQHVDALRHDVARTQDSLETVNSTLAILVDRLAAIEHGIQQRPVQAAPAHAAPAHLPPAPMLNQPVDAVVAQVVAAAAQIQSQAEQAQHQAPAEPTVADAPPLAPAGPHSTAPQPVPAPAQVRVQNQTPPKPALPPRRSQPIDPDLPPDHPIEPGMARPTAARSATVAVAPPSPAARIAASEAALGNARPPVIPDPAGQSNFIAAARRAAKAAEQEPGPPIPVPPRVERAAAAVAPVGGTRAAILGKLKSLMIASSVVAIVVGGYYVVGSMLESPPPAMPTSPAPQTLPPLGAMPETSAPATTAPSAPPAGAGSGFKLLAPDSTMQSAPGSMNIPAQPQSPDANSDITRSIGKRTMYPEKLPAAFSVPLRDAAASGDPAAAYEVAVRFAEGQGVASNLEEASRWFDRAAQSGLAPAQFRLGSLYEKGQGVRRDLKTARRLYIAAAEQGNAKAMHNLAVLFAEGIDGKQDYKTAAQWFLKASAYGVPDSQYNLAILYARGLGVEKSLVDAYKWFSLAAAQGDKESAKKRDEVGSRLDPASRTVAENAVKSWAPQLQPQQAIRVSSPPGGWDRPAEIDASTGRSASSGPVRIGAR